MKPNHFNHFVSSVYEKFNSPKQAINGSVGCLGQNNTKRTNVYFETDYNVVSNELINNDNNVEIHGVYKSTNKSSNHNVLNMTEDELTSYIHSKTDTETKPTESAQATGKAEEVATEAEATTITTITCYA